MQIIGRTIERYNQPEGYSFITKRDGLMPVYYSFLQLGTLQIPHGASYSIWDARKKAGAPIQPAMPKAKKSGR